VKKATQLMKILTKNYKAILPEKYAKVVLQVAILEERINTLMSFGLVDKASEMSKSLVELLEDIKKDYKDENK